MMTAERVVKFSTPTGRILLDDDGRVISNPTSSHGDDPVDLNDAGQRLWSMAERLALSSGRPILQCYEQVKQTEQGKALLREHAVNGSVMARFNANAGRRVSVAVTGECVSIVMTTIPRFQSDLMSKSIDVRESSRISVGIYRPC